jgi:tellurite resistance protein TerB
MFGMLKKKGKSAAAEVKKMEKRDLAEAVVGACLLVAAADGEIESEEIANMEQQLASHPALSAFGNEIPKMVSQYRARLETNFLIGKVEIMREISDCTHDQREAEDIFVAAISIAMSDGEVEPEEVAILKEIGQKLGQSLSAYGIEG